MGAATMAPAANLAPIARMVAPPSSYRVEKPAPKSEYQRVGELVAAWDKQSQDAALDTYAGYELLAYNPINGVVYLRNTRPGTDPAMRQVNTHTDSCSCLAHNGHVTRLQKRCRDCGYEAAIVCKHNYIVTHHTNAGLVLTDLPTPAEAARVIGQEVA